MRVIPTDPRGKRDPEKKKKQKNKQTKEQTNERTNKQKKKQTKEIRVSFYFLFPAGSKEFSVK